MRAYSDPTKHYDWNQLCAYLDGWPGGIHAWMSDCSGRPIKIVRNR